MRNRYRFASKVCCSLAVALAGLIFAGARSTAGPGDTFIYCEPTGGAADRRCPPDGICDYGFGDPCYKYYDGINDECRCECSSFDPGANCALPLP